MTSRGTWWIRCHCTIFLAGIRGAGGLPPNHIRNYKVDHFPFCYHQQPSSVSERIFHCSPSASPCKILKSKVYCGTHSHTEISRRMKNSYPNDEITLHSKIFFVTRSIICLLCRVNYNTFETLKLNYKKTKREKKKVVLILIFHHEPVCWSIVVQSKCFP